MPRSVLSSNSIDGIRIHTCMGKPELQQAQPLLHYIQGRNDMLSVNDAALPLSMTMMIVNRPTFIRVLVVAMMVL